MPDKRQREDSALGFTAKRRCPSGIELDITSVRNILLLAYSFYPVISIWVEECRPNPFDGVSDEDLRAVLSRAARKYDNVAWMVKQEVEAGILER